MPFFLRITWHSIYQRIVILTNCTKLVVNFQWFSIYLMILVATLHHVKNTLMQIFVVIGVFMRMILISNRGKYMNHIWHWEKAGYIGPIQSKSSKSLKKMQEILLKSWNHFMHLFCINNKTEKKSQDIFLLFSLRLQCLTCVNFKHVIYCLIECWRGSGLSFIYQLFYYFLGKDKKLLECLFNA